MNQKKSTPTAEDSSSSEIVGRVLRCSHCDGELAQIQASRGLSVWLACPNCRAINFFEVQRTPPADPGRPRYEHRS